MSFRFVAAALFTAAVALFSALAWRVPAHDDLLDRVAPPALSDRRPFVVESAVAEDDGAIRIAGRVPGVRIDGMRWYVQGGRGLGNAQSDRAAAIPDRLLLHGDRFAVELRAGADRDEYRVFAYAFTGLHAIAMRDEIVLRPPHVAAAEGGAALARQQFDPSIQAVAAIDQVWDGPVQRPLEGQRDVLHLSQVARLRFVGWAADRARGIAGSEVDAVFDGHVLCRATRYPRRDVAAYYRRPGYAVSGYSVEIPSTLLTLGIHHVQLRVVEGTRYGIAADVKVDYGLM